MSIKRISELPIISESEKSDLSSALLEFSVSQDYGNYESRCGSVDDIKDTVVNLLEKEIIQSITINNNLCVIDGDVIFNWDDEDAQDRKFLGKFGEISLCAVGDNTGKIYLYAQNGIELDSSPVVIARNLSVYNDRMSSDNVSYLQNSANDIWVKDIDSSSPDAQAVNYGTFKRNLQDQVTRINGLVGKGNNQRTLVDAVTDAISSVGYVYDYIYQCISSKYSDKRWTGDKTINNLASYLQYIGLKDLVNPTPTEPSCITYEFRDIQDSKYGEKLQPSWKQTLYNATYVMKPGMTDVYMPGITKLKSSLFNGYARLSSVSLPSVITLGSGTFKGCKELRQLTLKAMTSFKGALVDKNCVNIEYIEAPKCSSIGANAFKGSPIKRIKLGNVEQIPRCAFQDCIQLSTLDMTSTQCKVMNSAFRNCESLQSVPFKVIEKPGNYAFCGCKSLKSINIEGTTSLTSNVFLSCTSLTELDFSKNVGSGNYSVPLNAVKGCSSLKTIKLGTVSEETKVKNKWVTNLDNIVSGLNDYLSSDKLRVICSDSFAEYFTSKKRTAASKIEFITS